MGCSSSSAAPDTRVVIIGGGYGGVNLAKQLDGKVQVTIIEKRDTFNHSIANLRAVVDPKYAQAVNMPYTGAFKNVQIVTGVATAVDKTNVIVATATNPRTTVPYDYLVVSTGLSMKGPAKVPDTAAAAVTWFAEKGAQIAAAKHVTIVGGGSVGIELAGEIRHAHPDKDIIIVNSADELLASMRDKKPALLTKLDEKLKANNIRVLKGHRVLPFDTAPGAPDEAKTDDAAAPAPEAKTDDPTTTPATTFRDGFIAGSRTITTNKGESWRTDLVVWAVGGRPNSEVFADGFLAPVVGPDGKVKVGPGLRVEGTTNVFAMGDVAATGDLAIAYATEAQAKTVAANIAKASKGEALKAHSIGPSVIFLPVGPQDGVLQAPAPIGVRGNVLVKKFKGTLLVPDQAKIMGAPAPSL